MTEMPWDRARGANKILTFIVFIVRKQDYGLWTVPDRSLVFFRFETRTEFPTSDNLKTNYFS